jgi:lysophospholipase L1-like esterase
VAYARYVALGDSFTEGVGDPHPSSPNGVRGWADHVAVALAQNNPELRYANLAVRGRRMDEILADQLQAAVMLEPDLVIVYAGMNDLLLMRNDIDAMMARYADALKTLQQTGAPRVGVHGGRPWHRAAFSPAAGRAAVYNELLHGIAADLGLRLLLAVFRVSRSASVGWGSHPSLAARP